jgi:amidase
VPYPVVEATIAQLRAALEAGRTTSVEITRAYLARIAAYDHAGPRLNSVPVLNPDALTEAAASDARRAAGAPLSPLDGIPYTAKESFMAAGLTVSAGSPAFADLVATRDAASIGLLRAGGAVLVGLTTMPPMANGGMQRGLRGRAESPYNPDYLTSAFGSGSSNGSGTATAASFAAFGLAEETWSSGRAPASCNGLCAWTPSRGLISVRGNWPLVPTMDVVVPHTRTMADLLEVADVLVAEDPDPRGDLWRRQPWVRLPPVADVRPRWFPGLGRDLHGDPAAAAAALAGLRIGVPGMFVGEDPHVGTGPGIGASTGEPIEVRPSVLALWAAARADLEAAGALVEITDFPAVTHHEADREGAASVLDRGLVPPEFLELELWDLSMWAWDDFLAANGQPGLSRLAEVHGPSISPPPPGALPDRYGSMDLDVAEYVTRARARGIADPWTGATAELLRAGLEGLEATRRADLEDWMDARGLDVVAFPALADVGRADADVDEAAAEHAWRNGVWVAHGNLAIRHLGIPTVTVPMGVMADTGMPVGLTFAGRAYDDATLLRVAAAFEALAPEAHPRRTAPPLTPELT